MTVWRVSIPDPQDIEWTDPQQGVIDHRDGPIQVIACAGSGKTSTVSRRVAEMVADGIDRDSIVAFTFTENAADELKVRIREEMTKVDGIERESIGKMYVGTIHGFCQEVLNEYKPETLSYDILDENEVAAFVSQHYFDLELHLVEPRHPNAKMKKIRWFIEDLNTVRREFIEEEVRESDEERTQDFLGVYDRFRDLMERYHFFDFQELIYRTVRGLQEDEEFLESVRNRFQHIIVDEYQDINTAQEELIRLLAGEESNLCVVGDDDQSIYGWRGARPEGFRTFTDRYGGEDETLDENFRSTSLIVDIAEGVIGNNENRVDKQMETERDPDLGDVYQLFFETEQDELDFLVQRIEQLQGTVYEDPKGRERTMRYGDMAILVRRRREMPAIRSVLEEAGEEEAGIDYTVRGQSSYFERPEAAFVRLAFAFIARGEDDGLEVIDIEVSDSPAHQFGDTERHVIEDEDIRRVIQESPYLADREEEIMDGLRDKRAWYENPTSRRIYPQDELQDILRLMGVHLPGDEEDGGRFPEGVMYSLGRISELIKEFETVYEIIFPDQITDLVEFLDYAHFHGRSESEDPTLVDAVTIMTVHAAKGTEFPAVFLPGLTTYKFPRTGQTRAQQRAAPWEWIPQDVFDYATYETGEEELRRLFYVAVTRSQKYLTLTGARDNPGYENNHNPTQFYEEVEALELPGILTEDIPDPTPREEREIEAPGEGYVYPTSFSDIRYYQKCPFDYKLRKIYGFAPFIDPAFGYGFAIHDVLRELHARFEDDQVSLPATVGEVRDMVHDPDRFHLRYASGDIEDNLRDSAEDVLTTYATDHQEDMTYTYRAEEPFEYLIQGEDSEGSALVTGTIDLLEKRDPDTNEIREVDVIDFKTGEEPDYEQHADLRDHKFQVQLYGLATQEELEVEAVEGFIHYLSDGERVPVDLADVKLQTIETNIEQQVDRIMRRRFFATPEPEICAECDFKDICVHSEA